MGLELNLNDANAAVKYVRNVLFFGAPNRLRDHFVRDGMPNPDGVITWSLSATATIYRRRIANLSVRNTGLDPTIATMAEEAEMAHAGQCDEHAAVAFVYLIKNLMSFPVELVCRADKSHAFVLLGRSAKTDLSDPQDWNAATVVCDPWEGLAYPGRDIEQMMYLTLRDRWTGSRELGIRYRWGRGCRIDEAVDTKPK